MTRLIAEGQYFLFAALLAALVMSLTFHEFGHAFAAKRFGDDTAERQGRLTLNPVAHIDPLGLLMVVLIGFGYAKPVPTDPRNYNSFWAQLVVAAAGPLANLAIAVVAYNLFLYGVQAGWPGFDDPGVQQVLTILVIVNLVLMVFNLIPLGPLDGHYIFPYFLPRALAHQYRVFNARYGTYLFLGLILLSIAGVPVFRFVFNIGTSLLPYIRFV
ncbi:MAG: site-2 protease family protein [Hyphomicrobiaceae bacterium]